MVGYPYKQFGILKSITTPYVKYINGKLQMTNLNEYRDIVRKLDENLEKNGIIINKKPHNNKKLQDKNIKILLNLFKNIPGCKITDNLNTVKQCKLLNLEYKCENVIITYTNINDVNIKHIYLPFVIFINNNFNLLNNNYGEYCNYNYNTNIIQIYKFNIINNYKLLYGKYNNYKLQVISILPGSMYGKIGYIDINNNTFNNISALFKLPNYKYTLSYNSLLDFKKFLYIYHNIININLHEWVTFDKICILANININVAEVIFKKLFLSNNKNDIGMNLITIDYINNTNSILCLPGYTKYADGGGDGKLQHIDPLRCVLYSTNCIKLIENYQNQFPEIFNFLETNNPINDTINPQLIYNNLNDTQLKFKINQINNYCQTQPFKLLKLTYGNYQCLFEDEIYHILKLVLNINGYIEGYPPEVQSNSVPPEVTSTNGPTSRRPAVSSSNYLSLKSIATPGDRGEESETINGSRGEVNREATTASGMKSSTGPQVEPAADLREAEGEVNRGSRLQDEGEVVLEGGRGEDSDWTSSGVDWRSELDWTSIVKQSDSVMEDVKYVRVSNLRNLHIPAYNMVMPKLEYGFFLGQVVIYSSHDRLVPIGTRGTIIGLYPQKVDDDSDLLLEVLLHEPHLSATNLHGRCKNMHGLFVNTQQVLPLFPENVLNVEDYMSLITKLDRKNAEYIKYA